MQEIDSRTVIWVNVCALMSARWQGENLNRLAREARIGVATCQRLKAQKTSVGIEVIDKIAGAFGVEAWQLLVPTFSPASPPVLLPVSEAERQFYERMLQAAADLKRT